MPRPTSILQRPELSTIAYEFMLQSDRAGFIGSKIMPLFKVANQSADYPVIPPEAFLKIPETLRSPRSNYARGDWKFETATYTTHERGWEEPVDDVEANLYRRYFDAEVIATERAVDVLMRGHEKRVADVLMNTGNAIGNTGVSVAWSTAATCTPKADVKKAITNMRTASGVTPTHVVMSKSVFDNVMVAKEIKDYLQYTTPHLLNGVDAQKAMLAAYFGVDDILVGSSMMDSAKKGKEAVLTDVWSSSYVALAKLSTGGNDLREPAFGRTFMWSMESPNEVNVESYREESRRCNIIRVRNYLDEVVVFKGALYILTGVTA